MKLVRFVAFVAYAALTSSALECWVCENARSNEECQLRGGLKKCELNQKACQNELRTDNQGLRITKRCKQAHACENNFIQNLRAAWFPTQCNPERPHSACRCCCNTDNCNAATLGCLETSNTCKTPPGPPTDGFRACTDGKNLGSRCRFWCKDQYTRVGPPNTECIEKSDGSKAWNKPAPLCKRKICRTPPGPPINGFRVCTDGKQIGSKCEFGCNAYHVRVGPLFTECIKTTNGRVIWNKPAPICKRNKCKDQGVILHGNYSCTEGNFAASICTFRCTEEGYTLFPAGLEQNTCLNDTAWSITAPCCTRECPPYALMDAVFILDSSSSIGVDNWPTMKRFVKQIISNFTISDVSARFSAFRYNSLVDRDSQILLNKSSNISDFVKGLDNIPYNGSGTKTGLALKHVRDVIFRSENGDRPKARNVAMVITDGRSKDAVEEVARDLRNDGVLTYALGVQPPRGKLDRSQLEDIAGHESRMFVATGSFNELGSKLASILTSVICRPPCADNDDYNDKLRAANLI